MITRRMSCQEYYEKYLAGTPVIEEMLEDMRVSPGSSAERIYGRLLEEAMMDRVILLDQGDFNYQAFFREIGQLRQRNAS